jgi:hypothetical protein
MPSRTNMASTSPLSPANDTDDNDQQDNLNIKTLVFLDSPARHITSSTLERTRAQVASKIGEDTLRLAEITLLQRMLQTLECYNDTRERTYPPLPTETEVESPSSPIDGEPEVKQGTPPK